MAGNIGSVDPRIRQVHWNVPAALEQIRRDIPNGGAHDVRPARAGHVGISLTEPNGAPSAHVLEKACPGLDPGWKPVSRLREALARLAILARCFGGRRQVRKGHAQRQESRVHPVWDAL
jgi:hypothetical protein